MKQLIIILTLLWCPALGFGQDQPNLLLIVCDDLGYGDLSLHGNPMSETPHIDALGRDSVRMDHFHTTPVCSTSRTELLTGRNHILAGVWGVHLSRDYMHLDEVTLADALKANGYYTAMMGKWHSGRSPAWMPWNRGFDDAWVAALYKHQNTPVSHNGQAKKLKGWADDSLTDLAIEVMTQERDQPFFVMLSYLSPHGPIEAPQHLVHKYEAKGCSNDFARLNGMIEMVDNNVGRLMSTLKAQQLDKDTIVIFISDNGSTRKAEKMKLGQDEWAMRQQGLKGNKGNIWQNAMRAPCFVRWDGTFKPSVQSAFTTISDIFPTVLDFCGSKAVKCAGPLQGISWKPLLKGGSGPWPARREFFRSYWNVFKDRSWKQNFVLGSAAEIPEQEQIFAWYEGDHKLVQYRRQKPMLFDLSKDPGEQHNIASSHPERVKRHREKMRAAYGELLLNPRSYRQPRFHIGHRQHDAVERVGLNLRGSEIPTCGAVATTGGVTIGSHASSGYSASGDSQTILVDVVKAGPYKVVLDLSKPSAGAKMAVKVGQRQMEGELSSSRKVDLGVIDLLEGHQDLTLKLVSLPVGKKRAFEKISHIHFQSQR